MPLTNKAITHDRFVRRQMGAYFRRQRGKRERWMSVRETINHRRYAAFRPYHLARDGVNPSTRYTYYHAARTVREGEAIEAYFHALHMQTAGYAWCAPGTDFAAGVGGKWIDLDAMHPMAAAYRAARDAFVDDELGMRRAA